MTDFGTLVGVPVAGNAESITLLKLVPPPEVHVAVPGFVKSAAATPVTASEKTREYVKLVELVGELCADENDETVGGVVSTTIA